MSLIGLIIGIGTLFFSIIFFGFAVSYNPSFTLFIIAWLALLFGIIIFYAYNYFTEEGIAIYDIDSKSEREVSDKSYDFETTLRKLESLRRDGLISEREYKIKRDEIMRKKW